MWTSSSPRRPTTEAWCLEIFVGFGFYSCNSKTSSANHLRQQRARRATYVPILSSQQVVATVWLIATCTHVDLRYEESLKRIVGTRHLGLLSTKSLPLGSDDSYICLE